MTTRRVVLGIVLVALLVRLALFVADVGLHSLQMDLSSFYAAGLAAGAGLSPYVNHVEHDPPIWDGVDAYRHSRFLYPPPAARLFQPLSWFDYATVKFAWMLLSLAAMGAALAIALKRTIGLTVERALIGASVLAGFFPVMALLERGQVDGLTLLAIVVALTWPRGRRSTLFIGTLLALATLLKLYCLFLVPFLLLWRRWRLLAGFGAGLLALVLTGGVLDGFSALPSYVKDEMPRISRYGEGGSREMLLPPRSFQRVLAGVESGLTVMDGRSYAREHAPFVLNASAVRTPFGRWVWTTLKDAGVPWAPGHVSLLFFAVAFGVVGWLLRRAPGSSELLNLQIALVVVLLCAPVTWAMNVVWLLPLTVILLPASKPLRETAGRAGWIACVAGMALAGVPDSWVGSFQLRYVLALALSLAGLVALARRPLE